MNRNLHFANPIDWNIDRMYTPDEVVFFGNDAYTAKLYVPSGTSLEETDYWEKTADKDWIAGRYHEPTPPEPPEPPISDAIVGSAIVGEAILRS